MISSALLHWLVSQILFLIRLSLYTGDSETHPERTISTLGLSPMAIIFVILASCLVMAIALFSGSRKLRPGLPLVGSCSAGISAACHPPAQDIKVSKVPLMWGTVETEGEYGHCCFTHKPVNMPFQGEEYAGL